METNCLSLDANGKQEVHGPHRSPDHILFISINTYNYIITLIKSRKNIINFMRIKWFFKQTSIKLQSPSPKNALCQVWLKLVK